MDLKQLRESNHYQESVSHKTFTMTFLRIVPLLVLLAIPPFLLMNETIPAFARAVGIGGNTAIISSNAPASEYDWPQFMFNAQHSGNNTLESAITASNVNTLHEIFQISLPDVADGAPVYLRGISTSGGVKNLVFVTTKDGHIVALDALSGGQVWAKQHGPGTCKINNGLNTCYTTSSPAADPSRSFVYSYGLDGKVHKHQVGDGTEISTGGFPEVTTLKAFDEKGSPALSIATDSSSNNYLYMANGGYPGDNGDYQGHITAINLVDGSQKVFNSLCSNQAVHFVERPGTPDCSGVQSAIWARPGVVYDPATNRIYMSTGNADFAPASHFWGDTVFALKPDGTGLNGDPLDTFTPASFQHLQDFDLDLGSTAPAILPAPATSTVQHLAVQGGKDAMLRLLNLDNLSGQGGLGHTGGEVGTVISVPQGGEVLTQPAVWVNPSDSSTWVFVANGSGISGLKLTLDISNTPKLQSIWQKADPGSSPILANGVLFYAGGGIIRALNPTNGNLLWSDTQIGGIHWESPIVANGVLYVTDESRNLTAYGLNGPFGTSTPSPTSTTTPTPLKIFLPFILRRD